MAGTRARSAVFIGRMGVFGGRSVMWLGLTIPSGLVGIFGKRLAVVV